MSVRFNPSGSLNVAVDASDLPEQADGHNLASGEMVRCKNVRLNERGKGKTRDGSVKLNTTALKNPVWLVEEMAGDRYSFAGTAIYKNEVSIATGLTSAAWAAVQYNSFNDTNENVFALNGTDRKRVEDSTVAEWGIEAPTTAPTIGVGRGSMLTGQYNAKYTYVRKVGSAVVAESNASAAAPTAQVLAGQSLAIDVTQPSDSQVTHIRVYRTLTGGWIYYYDQEIAIDVTYAYGYTFDWEETAAYISGTGNQFTTADTTHNSENCFTWEELFKDRDDSIVDSVVVASLGDFDSNTSDSALGSQLHTDHDRPPAGSFVFGPAYDGTCFILNGNKLHYCKPKQPEYFPALYFIEVGPPQFVLQTGVFHNGQSYVLSKNDIYYVQGTGDGVFLPLPMKAKTGAQSQNGAVSVHGKGIYHTGPDGIYLFSGTDQKVTEGNLEPIFRGESVEGLPGVGDITKSWLHVYKNHLYFGYSTTSAIGPENILVLNLDTNRLAYYAYNDGSDVRISAITTDITNDRIIVGDAHGFVRVIEDKSNTDDSGTAINWSIQSKDFTLQTRKHFPRWVKYDVDVPIGSTAAGELMLDGASHQTHTITGSRNTKRRLVGVGNGNKAATRISGTGPATVYAAEFE